MKWERVELHCHTIASDGEMDPKTLVTQAIRRGYKAIVVSDHNTKSAIKNVQKEAKNTELLIIPGIEWTTFWGHIVVSGGNSNLDWTSINLNNIKDCIQKVQKNGDIVTLAHPKRLGTPFGAECRMLFNIDDIKCADAYEVWTHYNPNTQYGVDLSKKEWLDIIKTKKIAPVYGYDWHCIDLNGPSFAYTYVAIEGKITLEKVLNAIKNSHTYITTGVEVDCKLFDGKRIYIPGDEIKKGEYTLDINYSYINEYKEKYLCEVEYINIYEDYKKIASIEAKNNRIKTNLKVKANNFLRIELIGSMNNIKADITLLSPYYML